MQVFTASYEIAIFCLYARVWHEITNTLLIKLLHQANTKS